jgi:hypothetical protein
MAGGNGAWCNRKGTIANLRFLCKFFSIYSGVMIGWACRSHRGVIATENLHIWRTMGGMPWLFDKACTSDGEF